LEQPTLSLFAHTQDYQILFENAPDAVVLIDQYNNIQFWNPKAEAVFGWSSAEVIGKAVSDVIVPPAFREAHNSGMQRHLRTGEVRVLNKTIEVPALHRSGHEFFIALTISKVHLHGVTSFLAFIRDITEQKQSQADLEQKTLELERSNVQLQEFASIASHDLKEPLRKISMFTDVILTSESECLSEKAKASLQKIMDASHRMQRLIDGILSYSSIGAEIQKEECSLEVLLQESLAILESRIKETGATVTSDGLPQAEVVPYQMQQLFQNLISNALKFFQKGAPPQIRVTHAFVSSGEIEDKHLHAARQYLQIHVSDNGIGFDREASERIFGLFQRLHGKSAYEGSGIGLAICRKIADNHGGIITATSEPGNGSTFSITLPYRE
jgi:PAS domain S-box-containing protein